MSEIAAATPTARRPTEPRNLVEMNWDPITRIVGSLGIFTKIDFENRQVAECHSTSRSFAATASL
jgi:hydrogenase large subunit